MKYQLIHHTGCGSSKKGLALLQAQGIEPSVRKYMNKSSRLTEAELREIARKMGDVSPRAFMREKDAARDGIGPEHSDDEIYKAMALNPKLIQRPIGVCGDRAILGRPNARLLELL